MKKLITIIALMFIGAGVFGQNVFKYELRANGGLRVGGESKVKIDSIAISMGTYKVYNGSTELLARAWNSSTTATTVGTNFVTLANPSAITFPRINADNTVTALSATDTKTALEISDADILDAYAAMGADIKAMTVGATLNSINTSQTAGDGTLYLIPIYFYSAATLTYLGGNLAVLGSYTSDNYNGMGLYSFSAGTLTLERSTTDDGTIWSTALGLVKKAITSYSASAGQLMYIGVLWNASATTTAPSYAKLSLSASNAVQLSSYFTNSNSICRYVTAQTSLPASITLSSTSAFTTTLFVTAH